ncbi:hypothetical protein JNK13_00985 [bacterium]|nr:hypothetical protein [bacterium]
MGNQTPQQCIALGKAALVSVGGSHVALIFVDGNRVIVKVPTSLAAQNESVKPFEETLSDGNGCPRSVSFPLPWCAGLTIRIEINGPGTHFEIQAAQIKVASTDPDESNAWT